MLVGNQWFWVVSFMGANLFVHGAKEAAISITSMASMSVYSVSSLLVMVASHGVK